MSIPEYNRISTINSAKYTQVPPTQRVKPTDRDKSSGAYYRYFMSKSNGMDSAREVSKKTYDQFKDNNFWIGIALKWNISNSNASESNLEQIRMGMRTIYRLDGLLPNLVEFHTGGGYVSTGALEPSTDSFSEQSIFDLP